MSPLHCYSQYMLLCFYYQIILPTARKRKKRLHTCAANQTSEGSTADSVLNGGTECDTVNLFRIPERRPLNSLKPSHPASQPTPLSKKCLSSTNENTSPNLLPFFAATFSLPLKYHVSGRLQLSSSFMFDNAESLYLFISHKLYLLLFSFCSNLDFTVNIKASMEFHEHFQTARGFFWLAE